MKPELQTYMLVAEGQIDALARRASRRIGIDPGGARDAYYGWEWIKQVPTSLGLAVVGTRLTADLDLSFNEGLFILVSANAYTLDRDRRSGWSQSYLGRFLDWNECRFSRGLKTRVSLAIQQAWQDANRNAGRLEELAIRRQQLINTLTERGLYEAVPPER